MKKIHIKNSHNLKNLVIALLTTYVYTRAIIEADNPTLTIVFCTIVMFFCIGVLLNHFDQWVADMNKERKS